MHVKRVAVSVERSESVTYEVQYRLDVDLKDSDAAHKGLEQNYNYNTDFLSVFYMRISKQMLELQEIKTLNHSQLRNRITRTNNRMT